GGAPFGGLTTGFVVGAEAAVVSEPVVESLLPQPATTITAQAANARITNLTAAHPRENCVAASVVARDQVPGPAELFVLAPRRHVVGANRERAGVRARLRQALGLLRGELEDDTAVVDLVDLGRIGEPVPAWQDAGVEDDPVEDIHIRVCEDMLD